MNATLTKNHNYKGEIAAFFYRQWVSGAASPINPGGAQALGKELTSSVPPMVPGDCLHPVGFEPWTLEGGSIQSKPRTLPLKLSSAQLSSNPLKQHLWQDIEELEAEVQLISH